MREVKFFSGVGAPTVAPAFVGDVYMDTATGTLYTAAQFGPTTEWVQTLPLSPGASSTGSAAGNPGLVSSFQFIVPAGGGGAADDVMLFNANLPADVEVIGANFLTVGAVALSSVQVRGAAGGAGTPITGPISTAAAGRLWESAGGGLTSAGPFADGSSWFLRRSDSAVSGVLTILIRYV